MKHVRALFALLLTLVSAAATAVDQHHRHHEETHGEMRAFSGVDGSRLHEWTCDRFTVLSA
jgi:hypothetical protein